MSKAYYRYSLYTPKMKDENRRAMFALLNKHGISPVEKSGLDKYPDKKWLVKEIKDNHSISREELIFAVNHPQLIKIQELKNKKIVSTQF